MRDELARGQFVHRALHKASLQVTRARLWWGMRRAASPIALLYGKNDTEENLLVLALALTRRYEGRILIAARDRALVSDLLDALSPTVPGSRPEQIELVGASTNELVRMHASAEIVLTSHRLLAGPPATGRRLHAYVSHSVGPKTDLLFPSTETVFVVACSIWTEQILRNMHLPPDTPRLTGFPRLDLLARPPHTDRDVLSRLGLDPAKKLVVWAPTYKSITFYGDHTWNEGVPVSRIADSEDFTAFTRTMAEHADTVEFVCKPHPLEAEALGGLGFTVLTNDDLWQRAGLTAYSFLAHADAVVTDYSSIWVDFLATGRSIGVALFDVDVYAGGDRGFMEPDYLELIRNLRIDQPAGLREFLHRVGTGEVFAPQALDALRRRIGFVESEHYTEDLVRELRQVGLDRCGYDFGIRDVRLD